MSSSSEGEEHFVISSREVGARLIFISEAYDASEKATFLADVNRLVSLVSERVSMGSRSRSSWPTRTRLCVLRRL
jgi:hypothetical protein